MLKSKVYKEFLPSIGMVIPLNVLTFPNGLAVRSQNGGGQRQEGYQ